MIVPDPDDPHPRPWLAYQSRIWDANGESVPLDFVISLVNG